MPIRINLLAEAQAAEELRRKDPVKRALLAAVMVIVAVVMWSSTLQFKIISSSGELDGFEAKWKSIEASYKTAVESRRQSLEAEEKLLALQQLTTNRFLWGTALNAFQQTLVGVSDVQVVRLKTDQSYTILEEPKPAAGAPAKPSKATEKIVLTIDALDSSPQLGGHYKFKEAIAAVPFFQTSLQKTNGVLLTSLAAPQTGSGSRNQGVSFTLQCFFPERVR